MNIDGLKKRLGLGPALAAAPMRARRSVDADAGMEPASAEGPASSSAIARWYFAQIAAAEQSRIEQQARLATLAWRVAAGAMVTAVLVFLGSAALIMTKRPAPPVVIRDNPVTGQVDVIDMARSTVEFGQAEAIADLRRYVEQRESYDYETIQDLYDSVTAKSCGPELGRYTALYANTEPRSPLKLWKNEMRVIVKSRAVTFVGTTAQVFFERRFVSLSSAQAPATEYEVATIAYEHRNEPQRESQLLLNPTGFCVLSYALARDWTRAESTSPSTTGAAGVRR